MYCRVSYFRPGWYTQREVGGLPLPSGHDRRRFSAGSLGNPPHAVRRQLLSPGVSLMPRRSIHSLVMALAAITAVGCTSGPRTSDPDTGAPSQVAAVLQRELSTQLRQADPNFVVQPERVSILEYPSKVGPGVRYFFAGYALTEISHRYYTAVAATRGSTITAIRNASDWWSVLGPDWSPSGAGAAVEACEELVIVTRSRRPGEITFADGLERPRALFPEEAAQVRARIEPPRAAVAPAGGWIVDLWAVQPRAPRGGVKYRCTLPIPYSEGASASLARIDSLVFHEPP